MTKYLARKLQQAPKPLKDRLRNKIRSGIRINNEKVKHVKFKIADTIDELEDAYKLVHDQYVDAGYMDPCPSNLRCGIYNLLPETTTFIGQSGGETILTLTIFQDSELGLPMDDIYKDELDRLRHQGHKITEVGALASSPKHRTVDQSIFMYTNKMVYLYASRYLNMDDLVIAVNPRHEWFYNYILLFEKIGDLKDYGYVKDAPAVAYRADLRSADERYQAIYGNKPDQVNLYKFFFEEKSENILLPNHNGPCYVWDPEKIDYFFHKKTSLLKDLDKHKLDALKNHCPYLN